jgi:hypothetical protein
MGAGVIGLVAFASFVMGGACALVLAAAMLAGRS